MAKNNTSQYIPWESVSSITLINEDFKEYPILGGTGFFVFFPPYDDVFFITARHCIVDGDGKVKGELLIPCAHEDNRVIKFSKCLETSYKDDPDGFIEDIMVFVIGDISEDQKYIIKNRALRLQHQDDVDNILDLIISGKENIRTVGYPDVSKSFDYDQSSMKLQPRGFYAKISGKSKMRNCYELCEGSWKEESLSGFSGAPMLSLHPTSSGDVVAIPVGVFLTKTVFISINVATNLIANYFLGINIESKNS